MRNDTVAGNAPTVLDLHFQGREQAIASYLLVDDGGQESGDAALIEAGPGSTIDSLLAGLKRAGTLPERVTKLLLTHIHLDHAGASGSLVQRLPNVTVYVHEIGAPHMLDPSRLLRSAARIYGDEMDSLWGEFLPVPRERLVAVADGDRIVAGGRELEAVYTPGHASHHVAYWDASSRAFYTGDVAGIRLPGTARALPPTPPPDLDLEQWSTSIDRLLALEPHRLYLTHFGGVDDPVSHLKELRERLYSWGELVLGELRGGHSVSEVAETLERHADTELSGFDATPELLARLRLVSGYAMNVAGYARYYKHKGQL